MKPEEIQFSRRKMLHVSGGGAAATAALGFFGGNPVWIRSALAQATPAGSPAAVTGTDSLRLCLVGDFIPSFYPLGNWTGNQFLLYTMFFSTLVELDADLKVRGDLATEWTISEDAKTFTFKLNPAAKWHDAQPVTSKDVAFSFAYYLSDTTAVGFTTNLQGISGAKDVMAGTTTTLSGVQTPDDLTVIITLDTPNSFFLKSLRQPFNFILPEHVLKGVKPSDMRSNPFSTSAPIGSGPFKFKRMLPDQYVELDAFADGHLGAPRFAKVFQKFLTTDLALAQLQSGEIDLAMRLNPLDYDKVAGDANLDSVARPGSGITELSFNNTVITDKRVRQAFWYAIDRKGIVDGILKGRGVVLKAPPAMTNYPGLNDYAYNPDTAKSLLKEAGWDSSKTVRLIYDTAWPAVGDITPVIQQQLSDVGVTLELDPLDTATWTDRYRNKPDTWELAWGQGGTEALDPDVSTTYYNNNPKTAIGFYTNPDLQKLFEEGRATGDHAKRDQIYTQAALIINTEAPVIYLWTPYDVHGKIKKLQGVTVFPYAPETGNDVQKWSFSS